LITGENPPREERSRLVRIEETWPIFFVYFSTLFTSKVANFVKKVTFGIKGVTFGSRCSNRRVMAEIFFVYFSTLFTSKVANFMKKVTFGSKKKCHKSNSKSGGKKLMRLVFWVEFSSFFPSKMTSGGEIGGEKNEISIGKVRKKRSSAPPSPWEAKMSRSNMERGEKSSFLAGLFIGRVYCSILCTSSRARLPPFPR